jgi:hypothetical protein
MCTSTNIFVVLFVVSLLINGCGPVGVLGPKPDDPPFIPSVEMEKFKSEKAKREQVREHFGEPRFKGVNESYYCYVKVQARTRPCWGFVFFFPILEPDHVNYYQFVRFHFDSEGRVFDVTERWESQIEE